MEIEEAVQATYPRFTLIVQDSPKGYTITVINTGIPIGDAILTIDGFSAITKDNAKKNVLDDLGFKN